MKINYKYTTIILSVLVITLTSVVAVLAGNTDPPSGPADAGSQMYTLEQIYNRLDAGTAGTKMTTFTEPSSGPGSTMHTLDEIMAAAPEVSGTGAISTEVRASKTYWGLTTGEWGLQSGKLYGGCHCANGTLNGTRWCDNGDGTVTDLLGHNGVGQCLEWAQDAGWGGEKPWRNSSTDCSSPDYTCYDDAHKRASAYGPEDENWRLPTRAELYALTHGTEAVHSGTPSAFTGVQPSRYWSSTSPEVDPSIAWLVFLNDGGWGISDKAFACYVWPVRGGQ